MRGWSSPETDISFTAVGRGGFRLVLHSLSDGDGRRKSGEYREKTEREGYGEGNFVNRQAIDVASK